MNSYHVGDKVRCTGTFETAAGTDTDPSAVFFKVETPSGTETTYTYGTDAALVKSATGIYYVDVSITEAGTWHYRFYSTGTGQAAGEESFKAKDSFF
jgi:hypothetical protein